MANTKIPSELIADGAITSAKLDTNIAVGGTLGVTGTATISTDLNVGGAVKGNAGTRAVSIGTAGSVAGGLQLWSSPTSASYIQFGDEAGTAANHYRGFLSYSHLTDSMQVGTAGTERMRILAGGGITFNGDTAAANALDDYEEGIWTPAIEGTSSNPSGITYGTNIGRFTKIGRQVFCVIEQNVEGISSLGSGQFKISGLPFSSGTGDGMSGDFYALGTPNMEGLAQSLSSNSLEVLQSAGTAYMIFYKGSNGTAGMSQVTWSTDVDTAFRVRFQFMYMTE